MKITETILGGISASAGICIGKAYLVDREGVDVVEKYAISPGNLSAEVRRFKAAVKNAEDELRKILADSPDELLQQGQILEAHIELLNDKRLYGKTIEIIQKERINAEWALRKVASRLKAVFRDMTDPYLRERSADIAHVSDCVMRNLVGVQGVNIRAINKRVVLVAHDLSPAETSQINLERIMGFITDRGGKASHTGIIAQALGLPAVVGLEEATRRIKNDDLIIVDGTAGVVIVNPSEKTLAQYEERRLRFEEYITVITREAQQPAQTLDGFHAVVMGNIELPEEADTVIRHGGEGIGLYRTEFQYLRRLDFPSEDELFEKYSNVVERMTPLPVTLRTLDINGDKARNGSLAAHETNPALGLRAIRYCLKRPEVFRTQLRAILRAAAPGNVRVMFPMIATYFELLEARKALDEAAESLEKDGIVYSRELDVGIMIEVPSAVIIADQLAEHVDFFSIGTNDLIQYALAIDRGNQQVAHLYQPLDPAILRMLKHVADVAKAKGIKVYMCGEMAGSPSYVPILLGLGLDELSMNSQGIPAVKSTIAAIRLEDARDFVQEALKQRTARDVARLLKASYGDILAGKKYRHVG
jgi:phosphotransferase system enzyme I (PtsI)